MTSMLCFFSLWLCSAARNGALGPMQEKKQPTLGGDRIGCTRQPTTTESTFSTIYSLVFVFITSQIGIHQSVNISFYSIIRKSESKKFLVVSNVVSILFVIAGHSHYRFVHNLL